MCRRLGLDLARDPIPVGPAAHYMMGGVETDAWGRTSLPGLFAAGEVACTGVHGANRLASNSLLEGLVFGARAGRAMREPAAARRAARPEPVVIDEAARGGRPMDRSTPTRTFTDVEGRGAVPRRASSLDEAIARLDAGRRPRAALAAGTVRDAADWQRLNLVTVGPAHRPRGAAARGEPRAGTSATDFPARRRSYTGEST